MKKFFAISLLAATSLAGATAALAEPQDAAQSAATGQQQVVIKDQAEFQAYNAAIQQTDPTQQATALEAFLQQYPNTVVKAEVLQTLLSTYQKTGNAPKLLDTAKRILQVDPGNEQAQVVVAFIETSKAAQSNQNPQAMAQQYAEAAQDAQKALDNINKLPKPANMDDAQFQQQKNTIAAAMNGTIGFAHYLAQDYAAAVPPLFKAVQLKPDDFANMEYLGQSMAKPVTRAMMYSNPDSKTQLLAGVFWLCKAVSIAPAAAKDQFNKVAQYYYNRYHGSTDGFDQALAQAATMVQPTPDFKITPVPSPQEQAAQVLASTPPEEILVKDGFDTWASILTVAAPADAEKVWNATKGKPLDLSGLVVEATSTQIKLAVSDSAQAEKRADVIVQLKTPLTTPPAVGTADYEVVGIADSYTAQPAFMLTLTNGAPKAKAVAPTKKPAARRGTTTHRRPR